MKLLFKFSVCLLVIWSITFISCQKEIPCEGCSEKNKPPIANAGPDQVITLPTDSVLLDGTASSDPDGRIKEWLWTKISGPVSFNLVKPSDSISMVKTFVTGTYQFELKVTDNGGLSAKDTVHIIVDAVLTTNHPPIANAGPDTTITLPTNTINLDGNGSTDPDNNITSYGWTKISGPSSFNIANANAVQTQVTNLVQGTYEFELKVTDADGLFSKDTMGATVINQPCSQLPSLLTVCDNSIRPQICAQLIPVGTISQARIGIAAVSAGNKILFAGGGISSRVDIFDISSNSWSTAELTEPRDEIATAVLGNKIFFAGGENNDCASSRVDIYDAVNNGWSTAELSVGRIKMAGAAAGNKVLFAGGWRCGISDDYLYTEMKRVDIYDITSNTWSIDSLSSRPDWGTIGIASTVIDNKIYFAGASSDIPLWDFGTSTSTINIYDVSTNSWSVSNLSVARGVMAAIAVGDKNYWAGGTIGQQNSMQNIWYQQIEIRDANSNSSTFSCLFQPNSGFFTTFDAVLKNNKIIFFTGAGTVKDKFDIYDITTDKWSIGVLPVNISGASIISVNNTIYVAGGFVNGVLSNQVWKLEF